MIAILMSTYNGECYLREQIDSLLRQTYKDWILYIRDDGSVDNTISIIKSYECDYPDRIVYKMDDSGNLGPASSFMRLLSVVDANYYMFCDQDDVWLPDKIAITMARMLEVENEGKENSVLVYSDLQCVDEKLNLLPYTKWGYEHSNPCKIANIYDLLVNNQLISGCTMMMNSKSKEIVLPYKKGLMHDRWISLIVYHSQGMLAYIDQPLILYRITGFNTIGIQKRSVRYYLKKILLIKMTIVGKYSYYLKLKTLPFYFNFWLYFLSLIKRVILNVIQ